MTDKKSRAPVDLDSDNPSQNSRLHAATSIQSPVDPDQYPAEDRSAQVEAATGKRRGTTADAAKAKAEPNKQ